MELLLEVVTDDPMKKALLSFQDEQGMFELASDYFDPAYFASAQDESQS